MGKCNIIPILAKIEIKKISELIGKYLIIEKLTE